MDPLPAPEDRVHPRAQWSCGAGLDAHPEVAPRDVPSGAGRQWGQHQRDWFCKMGPAAARRALRAGGRPPTPGAPRGRHPAPCEGRAWDFRRATCNRAALPPCCPCPAVQCICEPGRARWHQLHECGEATCAGPLPVVHSCCTRLLPASLRPAPARGAAPWWLHGQPHQPHLPSLTPGMRASGVQAAGPASSPLPNACSSRCATARAGPCP